jgi:transcriptional regulator with XRE-family HTH domain
MKKKELYKIIGKNIQTQRKLKGYTQETFAELMNVSWSYVSKIECGILNLSIGKINDIANFLKLDIDYLLNTKNNST